MKKIMLLTLAAAAVCGVFFAGCGAAVRAVEYYVSERENALSAAPAEMSPEHRHCYDAELVPGNCTQREKTVHTCRECGLTYEEVTGEFGFHRFERTGYKAPSAAEDGRIVNTCRCCGEERIIVLCATGNAAGRAEP